jgi:tetratricopeptide (TPR) repeat protein
MSQPRSEIISYFENLSLLVIGILLIVFPIIFLSTTTDAFVLPKQIALAFGTTIAVLFFGLKAIADGKIKLRTAPFNLPVLLFLVVTFVSSILSVNRFDSLIAFVPLMFCIVLYFIIINIVKHEKQLLFLLGSLVTGASLSALLTIFSFFKIFPLPFEYTQVTTFTTFGSLLDQALYLSLVLPIAGYFAYSIITSGSRKKSPFAQEAHHQNDKQVKGIGIWFSVGFALIVLALALTLFMLFTSQKPLILPFETGLQTGFAALSQDTGRFFQGLLFGSGFGTYLTDFTRFKQATYNLNDTLWSFTFFRSSSLILELLATTGLAGVAAFLFLGFRIFKEGNFFLPLVLAFIAAIFLPFSFTLIALFFILLAIFSIIRIHSNPNKYGETEFFFVALKRGLFSAAPEGETVHQTAGQKRFSRILPVIFFLFLIAIIGVPMYYTVRFVISDLTFQKSLIAASQNKGLDTYNLEISAINTFPYRDIYYRAFAQTNLALANSLASSQKAGSQPDAQVQQNIVTLIQQSINAGRTAVQIAPLTAFNWNNLSAIYRSLIGFGQNADQFTVLSAQQAIALDPNNPQQYVELGGVYYQIGQYDEAIRQFQISIGLKNNYANAYYNLGHALEEKKDLASALAQYNVVKRLVAENPQNVNKIDAEIDAITKKIGEAQNNQAAGKEVKPSEQEAQQPLTQVDERPSTTLPERDPQVEIPGPTGKAVAEPTGTTRPTQAPRN